MHHDTEPLLNLVESRAVLGHVNEATATGVEAKSSTCAQLGRVISIAFAAQVLLYATMRCYQTHQGLQLMRVELIGDEDSTRLWIRLDGSGDVSDEFSLAL